MIKRVGALFATLAILTAQQQDDVAAYLDNLRAPSIRRMNLDALFQSGNASLFEGRYSEAEEIFRNLNMQEQDSRGLEGVARVYLAQNRNVEALTVLQSEVARNPARLDILFAFVRIAVQENAYDLALSALASALEGPWDARRRGELYFRMGELYRQKSDPGASVASFRKAKELLPEDTNAKIQLAQALAASGQDVEASQTYRAVLGVDPHDGPALTQRASLLSTSGNLDVAAECAELARKMSPDDPSLSDILGWIYIKKGMSKLAIPIYVALVDKAPLVSTYHYHFAMALGQTGDMAASQNELQAALKCNPSDDEREQIETMASRGLRK